MDEKLKKVQIILKKYNQEQLLDFYDEINEFQKLYLLDQILGINFDEILCLYNQSKFNVLDSTYEIEPLDYIDKNDFSEKEINFYTNIGINAIKNGEIAVITLAGGQGSRLGFKGPKGAFLLDTKPKISLFEVLCNYLKNISEKLNVYIPWYIMTSSENHASTIEFFKLHNFFDYPQDYITFFSQENMPLINVDGKLILEEVYKVKFASNGNGNLFKSLYKYNLIDDMIAKNIKWCFVGGVDNVLLNPLDPVFIGVTIDSDNPISSKTLFKEDPADINWIFARKNSRPAIVDCENFTNEISRITDDSGRYLYRETNMLAHLFSIDAIKYMSTVSMPYHRAFRKCPFVNYEGMKQIPEKPNIYKFEQFVFDAFSHFDDITLLRVNANEEFAPIKSFQSPHNPEIAKELYEKYVLHIEATGDID